MGFGLFDRKAEFVVHEGTLPHWFQPGVTYFVTFRTNDSVPQELARSWQLRRATWLRRRGFEPSSTTCKAALAADPNAAAEYRDTFETEFAGWLDRGFGECVLARPDVAAIVAESLQSGDGTNYHLGDFVVMPNHVHILVGLNGNTAIEE